MKISSISASGMPFMQPSHHAHEPLLSKVRHTLRALFMKLDHIGIAIALSEAGDLDGAKLLRVKHAK
jgi:hypothetical protein